MTAARSVQPHWSWSGLAMTLLASALWGLAPVATKGAMQGFGPEVTGFVRLVAAAAICWVLGKRSAGPFFADGWLWLAGVALGADFILYNYGLQRTSAGVSGLVINVEVASTIGFAVWLLDESLTVRRVVGCAVTLVGVLIVSSDRTVVSAALAGEYAVGNLMVMAAGIAWSLFAVAQRRSRSTRNLFRRLATIFAVAALTIVPTLLHRDAWVVTGGVRPITMLIVLTTLCTGLVYVLYARAQELIDVSVLAILLSSIPVFAVLFAYVILGEPVTRHLLIGGAVIVAGIVVIASERTTVAAAPAPLAPQPFTPGSP